VSDDKTGVKVCRDCGAAKALSEFWKSRVAPDGLAPYCVPCFKQRNAASDARRAAKEGRQIRRRKSSTLSVPEGMKFCPSCEQVLAIDQFVRNRSAKSGIGSYCRPCQNAKAAESIERLYGSTRHYHLKQRYGIGAAEVEQMLDAQGWSCPLCFTPLTLKSAHVDHDHVSGAVRGILCSTATAGSVSSGTTRRRYAGQRSTSSALPSPRKSVPVRSSWRS
jgi:DNA-directed RNA polymerase subunit M/transcription elongation factor TFIIS